MPAPDIGVFLPSASSPGEPLGDMAASARHVEDLGLESAWVIDQLVAGTGNPLLDSSVALAAATTATRRIKLAFGVVILPLHPVAWLAKQVASLQHVSGDRIILGVGAGGDRHELSWAAAGVPRTERGRRTDAALEVLPSLIAGKDATLEDLPGSPTVRLAPAAAVPPIVVGGMSRAALRRAATYADGWFSLPVGPQGLAEAVAQLDEEAQGRGRPRPQVTGALLTVLVGDPDLPDRDGIVRRLTDPDGMYGMPAEAVDEMLVEGDPAAIAGRLAELATAGADRVVVSLAAGNWYRQAELVAEARALLT